MTTDNTVKFDISRLLRRLPKGYDTQPAAPTPALLKLRTMLSAYEVERDETGMAVDGAAGGTDFANFLQNMRGAGAMRIKDVDFIYVMTRSKDYLFIISDTPTEEYNELAREFGSVDFKRRIMLRKPRESKPGEGEACKGGFVHKYVCLLLNEEFEVMRAVAAFQQPPRLEGGIPCPIADKNQGIELSELKDKLSASAVVEGQKMNVRRFAKSVKFVIPLGNESEDYYYIMAGTNDDIYRLYVNRDAPESGEYEKVCTIRYKDDQCELVREL
jgi:hypothetical protein